MFKGRDWSAAANQAADHFPLRADESRQSLRHRVGKHDMLDHFLEQADHLAVLR
jgi:hypothetical protein